MRIIVCVVWVCLMVSAVVAQDDPASGEKGELDGNAIAAKIQALHKHVAIGPVRVKEVKNRKTNVKAKIVTIATEQDQDAPFLGTMRFTIEMVDGTNIWYGQEQLDQVKWTKITSGGEDTGRIDYTGEDIWTFRIPFGKGTEIERPDVTTYAAEYGFVVSNKLVVVAAKCKDVASGDEIMARHQGSKNVLEIRSAGRALKEGEGDGREEEGKDDE